jgi:hypothetical protein
MFVFSKTSHVFCGRGLGPWGPDLVHRYTSARFIKYSTGELLTESESKLLIGMGR